MPVQENATMGGLFKSPKPTPAAQPVATIAAPPAVTEPSVAAASDPEEAARRQRVQAMVQQRRGRASTITTSPRGLLISADNLPVRKSLLGE
jgi:hypothetical protein